MQRLIAACTKAIWCIQYLSLFVRSCTGVYLYHAASSSSTDSSSTSVASAKLSPNMEGYARGIGLVTRNLIRFRTKDVKGGKR
ncbi:uncharacterized protein BDZ83DRAFT_607208 [Colletotrichum acutatum]|uniref:Uncharacterized protein n=1 Tax=Glomerella acutata TaxID=27357 RepID=A0AAD8XK64_GLOAC|nr:uncharacterized protein BDZ83DRAFT_607208 [Colletotrichum acutatum]KAK1728848.1 hypothetical protein BDZ83DRAFT_607208 [Colletotrichum acutatum]